MGEAVQIWHNTRCSKSRNAFQWLADKGIDAEWIDYMKQAIKQKQLAEVLKKLNMSAFDLIRKSESIFIANWKNEEKSEAEWITLMCENPKLIERPIVVKGDKAIVARPLEKIEELF
jgi:arsenate reductase